MCFSRASFVGRLALPLAAAAAAAPLLALLAARKALVQAAVEAAVAASYAVAAVRKSNSSRSRSANAPNLTTRIRTPAGRRPGLQAGCARRLLVGRRPRSAMPPGAHADLREVMRECCLRADARHAAGGRLVGPYRAAGARGRQYGASDAGALGAARCAAAPAASRRTRRHRRARHARRRGASSGQRGALRRMVRWHARVGEAKRQRACADAAASPSPVAARARSCAA